MDFVQISVKMMNAVLLVKLCLLAERSLLAKLARIAFIQLRWPKEGPPRKL